MSTPPSEPRPKAPLPARPEPAEGGEERPAAPRLPLDLSGLDLSVEKVEERISPSETNVFDK